MKSLIKKNIVASFAPKSDIERRTIAGVTFTTEELAEITGEMEQAELEWFDLMEKESL
jgi:hypothetical protein